MLPTMLPIILTIRDEDDQSFVAEVYTSNRKRLEAIAKYHLENHLDVEDCIQDVFIVLIDCVDKYRYWSKNISLIFWPSVAVVSQQINTTTIKEEKAKNSATISLTAVI